ncbi:hypothetical protein AS149_13485 [Burkholderia cenocepacia]|nr:hypothetical protein AS149_13485 [Burkholderia cenocepacia]
MSQHSEQSVGVRRTNYVRLFQTLGGLCRQLNAVKDPYRCAVIQDLPRKMSEFVMRREENVFYRGGNVRLNRRPACFHGLAKKLAVGNHRVRVDMCSI